MGLHAAQATVAQAARARTASPTASSRDFAFASDLPRSAREAADAVHDEVPAVDAIAEAARDRQRDLRRDGEEHEACGVADLAPLPDCPQITGPY